MRRSKFTEAQIVSILKEADIGRPADELGDIPHELRDLLVGKPGTAGWRRPISGG